MDTMQNDAAGRLSRIADPAIPGRPNRYQGGNRSFVPVRSGSFYRLRTRFQSLRSGRSQMSFLGLSASFFVS